MVSKFINSTRLLLIVSLFLFGYIFQDKDQIIIYMVGDSTMADKPNEENPERGWGQMLPLFFDSAIIVENHAKNGRSTKSFMAEGRWEPITSKLKKGDYVIIQFGHNDESKEKVDRYTPPEEYKKNLIKFVQDTRKKEAIPILCTPVVRRRFDKQGHFLDSHGVYPDIVRDVAKKYNVYLIDMHNKSEMLIKNLGVEESKIIFLWVPPDKYVSLPDGRIDNTHFSEYGAFVMAQIAVEGIEELNINLKQHTKEIKYESVKRKTEKRFDQDEEIRSITSKAPFTIPDISAPKFSDKVYDIRDFGAVADGRTLNTSAINNAIHDCSRNGGGTVIVPPGTWKTGPIKLESFVRLHLQKGSLIQFSNKYEDFPLINGFNGKSTKYQITPPISAYKATNIAITGEGVIDGAGEAWRYVKKEKLTENQWKKLITSGGVVSKDGKQWWPSREAMEAEKYLEQLKQMNKKATKEDYEKLKEYLRPDLVRFVKCKNILFSGTTFRNSPRFHIYPFQSEDIIIRNVHVLTDWFAQNGDGIDLGSCRNVVIYNSTVDVGDDAICLKPGTISDDQIAGPACENIIVTDCKVYHGHGGFVIGSESSGGARNVLVKNCIFIGTDVGLRFKSNRGKGGVVENVYISDIQMLNIEREAIIFDMFYEQWKSEEVIFNELANKEEPLTNLTPSFQNFYLQNIYCNGASRAVIINGLPEMAVKKITMENINITADKGVLCMNTDSVIIKKSYFATNSIPIIDLFQSSNVTLSNVAYPLDVSLFLRAKGNRTKNVLLENINQPTSGKFLEVSDGVKINEIIKK